MKMRLALSSFALLALLGSAHVVQASAYDNAGNYTSFTNSSNGGTGFQPWSIISSGNAGPSIGSSTGNGGLGSIDTSGKSFGLNAAGVAGPAGLSSIRSSALRKFTQGALNAGQTFSIDIDMNTDVNGQQVSLNVAPSGNTATILGPTIYGLDDYYFTNNGAFIFTNQAYDTGIPFDQPVRWIYKQTTLGLDTVTIQSLVSSLSYTFTGASALIPDSLYVEVDSDGLTVSPNGALYFNNFGIDMPSQPAPEPGMLSGFALGIIALLRRRR